MECRPAVEHMLDMIHSFEPMTEQAYQSLQEEFKQHGIDFIDFRQAESDG